MYNLLNLGQILHTFRSLTFLLGSLVDGSVKGEYSQARAGPSQQWEGASLEKSQGMCCSTLLRTTKAAASSSHPTQLSCLASVTRSSPEAGELNRSLYGCSPKPLYTT